MPKLKTYYLRHVVGTTECSDVRARKIYTMLFPEKDIKNSTRKLTHEEYKLMCRIATNDKLYKSLKDGTSYDAQEQPAIKEHTKDGYVMVPSPKSDETVPIATLGNEQELEKWEEQQMRMIRHQRSLCDTILKPLVYEISQELNRGTTEEKVLDGKRGVWSHLYTLMENRYGISFRKIRQYQQLPEGIEMPSQVYIVVNTSCVQLMVDLARNWLADIKRKQQHYMTGRTVAEHINQGENNA